MMSDYFPHLNATTTTTGCASSAMKDEEKHNEGEFSRNILSDNVSVALALAKSQRITPKSSHVKERVTVNFQGGGTKIKKGWQRLSMDTKSGGPSLLSRPDTTI